MKRLLSYAVVPIVALSLASCEAEDSPDTQRAAAPATVSVPNTTGDPAPAAKRTIAAAGPDLTVQYSEEPDDPAACTVADQDATGRVAADTTVTLTLECKVEVPDVTGEPAEDARASIEGVGQLGATLADEPEDTSACTVSAQKPEGGSMVSPDTNVTLTLRCDSGAPDATDDGGADNGGAADDDGGAAGDGADDGGATSGDDSETSSCEPGYDPCLNADSSDYDCEGGSGDGPDYTGPVTVSGEDRFDLDRDGDGSGCDE